MRTAALAIVSAAALATQGWAAGKEATKTLPFPPESRSLETLTRSVQGAFVDGDRVLILPTGKDFVIVTPFSPKGATREAVFGKITDSRRSSEGKSFHSWVAIDAFEKRLMLVDGRELTLVEVDRQTLDKVLTRSVARDLLKPPADRIGEATTLEIQELRRNFKSAWNETRGDRITGMALVSTKGDRRTYLLSTRISGFPILQMDCGKEGATSCLLTRACPIVATGLKEVNGIAYSAKRDLVVLGDRAGRALHFLKWKRCGSTTRRGMARLPERLRELTGIHVDQEDRLWVATLNPDDYLNASLYFWLPPEW